MFDLEATMGQAREFQKKLKDDLQKIAITSSSGGGAVNVVVNGNKEITKIDFSPEAMDDHEILADLVLAAVSGAYAEVDKELQGRLPNLDSMDLSSITDMFKK